MVIICREFIKLEKMRLMDIIVLTIGSMILVSIGKKRNIVNIRLIIFENEE